MSKKTVLLIALYDRIALGVRQLSSVLATSGIPTNLLLFKSERTAVIERLNPDAKYYQLKVGPNLIGCGEDVNEPTDKELFLLADYVERLQPTIIGISSRTAAIGIVERIVPILRAAAPGVACIAGGFGPTSEPREFLKFVDFVLVGEGEQVITELVTQDPRHVPGVCWLEGSEFRYNAPLGPADISELPWPDRHSSGIHLIEDGRISPAADTGPAYDIFTSRGCPSSCTYCQACQANRLLGHYGGSYPKWRQRSVQSVMDELRQAVERQQVSLVRFKDSIFTVDKEWVMAFLDRYESEIGLPFHCFLDERYVDAELVRRLRHAGMCHTTVGIQSVSERVRKRVMGRPIGDQDLLDYAWLLARHDVPIKYDLIGWNPYETEAELQDGFEFLRRFPKGTITVVYQLKVFPGTPLARRLEQDGLQARTDAGSERWATLYQMVLHSEHLEDLAVTLKDVDLSPVQLNKRFVQELEEYDDGYRVTVRRPMSRGEVLRVTDIEFVQDGGDGLRRQDVEKVLHRELQRDVVRGGRLRWSDLYGSYESLQEFLPGHLPSS